MTSSSLSARDAETLAKADQWEAKMLAAIDAVRDPDEAEKLLKQAATIADAMQRMGEVAGDYIRRWRGVQLLAEHAYGEALGSAEDQGHTGRGHSVSSANAMSGAERVARRQARKVAAAVDRETLKEYVANSPKPSREGLLREYGSKPKAKAKASPKKRKAGGQATVKDHSGTVTHDVRVLNFVRAGSRKGMSTTEIIELSRTSPDWPMPGKPLSDGSMASCRAAIHHLEVQGATWPLKAEGGAFNGEPKLPGKRYREYQRKASAARKAGHPDIFWKRASHFTEVAYAATGLITSVNEFDLEEYDKVGFHDSLTTLTRLLEDAAYMIEIGMGLHAAIEGRLSEDNTRTVILKLRERTVARGCTAEEEAAARAAIDRLERKLTRQLT